MKIGAITDGISMDFEYALKTMQADGLGYAELQYIWGKEIGDHTDAENEQIKALLDQYGMKVSVVSRQTFMGLPLMTTEVESPVYQAHFDALCRTIELAKFFGTKVVRTMTFSKTVNIWGYDGADRWMAGNNKAWPHFLKLYEPIVQKAEDNGVTLVMETGTNAMVCSGYLGKRLIEDLGTKNLKVLWDPCNTLCCAERPFPDAYEEIKGVLGHIHIKDLESVPSHATVRAKPLGTGDLGKVLPDLAAALKRDGYDGAISLEVIYRPEGGTFEDGYHTQVGTFTKLFA